MRLGTISFWGGDQEAFREELRTAERLGVDLVAVGDVPAFHDPVLSLGIAAGETHRAMIGPMVTSPHMRHPVALVRAMSALQELSGGRAVLGLGTGNSLAGGLGQPPTTQSRMRDYVLAVRALALGREASLDGGVIKALQHVQPVPIYYSAQGPKALRLAGEIADGAIIMLGSSFESMKAAIEVVRLSARDAGRDQEIDIWAHAYVSVGASREQALRDISDNIATNAVLWWGSPEATARIPEHLRPAVLEAQRRYDWTDHARAGGKNGPMAEELGLLEFLSGVRVIAGTPDEVGRQLRELEALGVSLLMTPVAAHPDPGEAIHRIVMANRGSASPS